MSQPQLLAELALSTRPTEAPTWVDVTSYLRGIPSIRRGRGTWLGPVEPGTASALLDNADRRFDPSYAAGPYYGNLKPMRRIRLSAIWSGLTYPLFTGYVDGWPPEFTVGDGWVEVRATDGFKVLGRIELNTAYPEQLSHERVNAVLDTIGWTTGNAWILGSATNGQLGVSTVLAPAGDRTIMTGNTTVQAETLEATRALDHLQQIAQTENGLFLVARDGSMVFQNRHYRLKPDQTTPLWTFGDDLAGGELPYVRADMCFDDGELANDVRCTRNGGTTQVATDTASQLDYFPVTLAEDRLLATTDLEMLARANWLLAKRKQPAWRVRTLTLDPEGTDELWPIVLRAEIGDRVRVRRRPFGGAVMEGEYHIGHIQINVSSDEFRWSVVWELSPADMTKYWHVSDGADAFAAYAVLGTTTVLAY